LKAVVMAGGEGTRLRPLTSNQPKPMVPIVGKPCMEHIVELLKRHGFSEIVVTLAFMPQAIRSYFGTGEAHGATIKYSVEESPAGTAGSVKLAEDELDDTFLVISGDALCDIDLGALVRFHADKGGDVTLALKSVDNPLEFGIVVTDDDGRVERFLEKPSWGSASGGTSGSATGSTSTTSTPSRRRRSSATTAGSRRTRPWARTRCCRRA
jgi:mannose-1-phosphate guanylyltransferase/phosphomannomutase